MYLKDYLYGEYIVEPVIEELINTKEVQRLKNIHQGGASYLVNPNWNVSRYEHSIGVMLRIRLLGGRIEEQIAGSLNYNVRVEEDSKNYDIHQKNKLRLIDPSIYIENKIYKSSEISSEIKELSKKALEKSIKGTYIKIL